MQNRFRGIFALIAITGVTACGRAGPSPAPPDGMTILTEGELADLLIGKRIASGAVSFFEIYLPGGRFVQEQDIGIARQGTYVIENNRVCWTMPDTARPTCASYYRNANGAVVRAFDGLGGAPQSLDIIGNVVR